MVLSDVVVWCLAGAVFGLVLGSLVTSLFIRKRLNGKLQFLIDALEDNEMNIRFKEKRIFRCVFNVQLNRLRDIYERKQDELFAREAYYARLLDQVKSGVLVVDQTELFSGRVIYANAAALSLLGMSGITHLRQLRLISEELAHDFMQCKHGNELHTSLYNERGKVMLSLSAIEMQLDGKAVKVVVFHDITTVMESHENISWDKLIRVLTHEIMNTVMPIASLSQALQSELPPTGKWTGAERAALQQGLETIASSADGLVRFVQTYRKMTHLAAPVKRALSVRDLVDKVILLTQEQRAAQHVEMTYTEYSEDILLYADEGQLSQVLVNMVKNAVQAEARHIDVTAVINANDAVELRVINDGLPVSKENQEEIFIPFYTTKSDGSGIGLSLSRQIMRMHNGSLQLERSNEQSTSFLLVFK